MSPPEGRCAIAIEFYSTKGPYGAFSNFSAHPFELDGRTWPTSEHYFQAAKFAGTGRDDYLEQIRTSKSPMIAARLGRSRDVPLRADWEAAKDDVMRRAVLRKFEITPGFRNCSSARATRTSSKPPRTTTTGAAARAGTGRTCWG